MLLPSMPSSASGTYVAAGTLPSTASMDSAASVPWTCNGKCNSRRASRSTIVTLAAWLLAPVPSSTSLSSFAIPSTDAPTWLLGLASVAPLAGAGRGSPSTARFDGPEVARPSAVATAGGARVRRGSGNAADHEVVAGELAKRDPAVGGEHVSAAVVVGRWRRRRSRRSPRATWRG